MKDCFTIGELAKVTGATKKGLLYYEKIGLIEPSFINEENGYRYYAPSHIPIVETIQLGVLLGIPLKDISNFFDRNKSINYTSFFEYGKELAETKIRAFQHGLNFIEHTQNQMKVLKIYKETDELYERNFDDKFYLVTPYNLMNGEAAIYTALNRLYEKASAKDFIPLFERGVLYEYGSDNVKTFVFMEIVQAENAQEICRIIPAGRYKCHIVRGREIGSRNVLFSNLSEIKSGTVVIAVEIFSDNHKGRVPMSEVRVIDKS